MIGIMVPLTITLYRLHAKFMYVPNFFCHWLLLIHFFCTNAMVIGLMVMLVLY